MLCLSRVMVTSCVDARTSITSADGPDRYHLAALRAPETVLDHPSGKRQVAPGTRYAPDPGAAALSRA